jgi:hypothetical protein
MVVLAKTSNKLIRIRGFRLNYLAHAHLWKQIRHHSLCGLDNCNYILILGDLLGFLAISRRLLVIAHMPIKQRSKSTGKGEFEAVLGPPPCDQPSEDGDGLIAILEGLGVPAEGLEEEAALSQDECEIIFEVGLFVFNEPHDPQNPHEDLMDALRGGIRDVFPEGRGVERKFINRPARQVF